MRDVKRKRMHRVVLRFPGGLSRSVFVKARGTYEAEKVALRKYPDATGINRSSNPLN